MMDKSIDESYDDLNHETSGSEYPVIRCESASEWRETNCSESEEGGFSFSRSPNTKSGKSVCFHSISCNPNADRKVASRKYQ